MKLNLTKKDIEFLNVEFGITEEALMSISKSEWMKLRERCLDIDVDEAIKQDKDGVEFSERGMLADKIIDMKFSQLFI